MSTQYKKDSQLPTRLDLTLQDYVTLLAEGSNWKGQLGAFVQLVADNLPERADKPYWLQVPGYSVDEPNQLVEIEAGGSAQYNATSNTVPQASIPYALAASGKARFDAVVFDTIHEIWELVTGTEEDNPVTPAFNTRDKVLLTYLFIDETGLEPQTPPNDHVQNTDQYLDFGGGNQVSAALIRNLMDRYASHHNTLVDLQQAVPVGTAGQWATVGDDTQVYTWSETAGDWLPTQAEATAVGYLSFWVNGDLDTVPAGFAVVEGPLNITDEEFSLASGITSLSYEVAVDAASPTFSIESDLAALNTWVDSNVSTDTTKWLIRPIPDDVNPGEHQIKLQYE